MGTATAAVAVSVAVAVAMVVTVAPCLLCDWQCRQRSMPSVMLRQLLDADLVGCSRNGSSVGAFALMRL